MAIGRKDNGQPSSVSVELIFSADPGVFEFDIQDADSDTDSAYQVIPAVGQINNVKIGADGKAVARVEMVPFRANFLRLNCVTPITNGGVTVTARVFQS